MTERTYQADVIGLIYKPTGKKKKVVIEGETTYEDEVQPIAGWHVNTVEPVEAWAEYRLQGDAYPTVPHRVYAGGVMPICYSFPDEDTYNTMNPEVDYEIVE